MAGSRARGLGYGSVGGSPQGDDYRAHNSGLTPAAESRQQQQHRSWLRVGIASIAVVASIGLLSASRWTHSASSASGLGDETLAGTGGKGDAPQVGVGTTAGASAVGSEGEKELSFVASNEYTRRGDVVGLGYPWLQVYTSDHVNISHRCR